MSNNIETPEFWEQVKQDYKGINSNFLCNESLLFKTQWDTKSAQIRDFAIEFMKGAGASANKLFHCGGVAFLFASRTVSTDLEKVSIRVDFLNYMIQKTKNNLQ